MDDYHNRFLPQLGWKATENINMKLSIIILMSLKKEKPIRAAQFKNTAYFQKNGFTSKLALDLRFLYKKFVPFIIYIK